jgi:hypothetical protein
MTFLLHVEFDATSEPAATKILECLAGMAEIVDHDHPKVYTYVFRYADESKTKLMFTEIYADEQVFLDHGRDLEFGKLLQRGFNSTTGKSRKELCIRDDINIPFSQITASILDNYLHVTHISLEQGFLHRNSIEKREVEMLLVCIGCDPNVYDQLNALVSCVTCITFEESGSNKQLIAVITNISGDKKSVKNPKPSIDMIEIVCSSDETIKELKHIIDNYFQVQSIRIQTVFSGYIRHKSLS